MCEERANNSRDSGMDDKDLQRRTNKVTYRTQRTRTVDRDDKKLFLYHASAEEKSSAPSDAVSDQKVEMKCLAQREIGSENIGHLLTNRITEPPTVNGREIVLFRSRNTLAQQSTRRYEALSLIATTGKATRKQHARQRAG
jgi:hypothetical protein